MNWNINIRKTLIGRGYTFQKLYARNYITYRKKINDFTIWLWLAKKDLWISDWHQHTDNIIEYFKNNSGNVIKSEYLVMWVEEETGLITPYNREDMILMMSDKTEEYDQLFKDYRKIVIHIATFKPVLTEIEYLTKEIQ